MRCNLLRLRSVSELYAPSSFPSTSTSFSSRAATLVSNPFEASSAPASRVTRACSSVGNGTLPASDRLPSTRFAQIHSWNQRPEADLPCFAIVLGDRRQIVGDDPCRSVTAFMQIRQAIFATLRGARCGHPPRRRVGGRRRKLRAERQRLQQKPPLTRVRALSRWPRVANTRPSDLRKQHRFGLPGFVAAADVELVRT